MQFISAFSCAFSLSTPVPVAHVYYITPQNKYCQSLSTSACKERYFNDSPQSLEISQTLKTIKNRSKIFIRIVINYRENGLRPTFCLPDHTQFAGLA